MELIFKNRELSPHINLPKNFTSNKILSVAFHNINYMTLVKTKMRWFSTYFITIAVSSDWKPCETGNLSVMSAGIISRTFLFQKKAI